MKWSEIKDKQNKQLTKLNWTTYHYIYFDMEMVYWCASWMDIKKPYQLDSADILSDQWIEHKYRFVHKEQMYQHEFKELEYLGLEEVKEEKVWYVEKVITNCDWETFKRVHYKKFCTEIELINTQKIGGQ